MIEIKFESGKIILVFKTQVSEEYKNEVIKHYSEVFKDYINKGTTLCYEEDFFK